MPFFICLLLNKNVSFRKFKKKNEWLKIENTAPRAVFSITFMYVYISPIYKAYDTRSGV